ncbi:MAG: ligase-associated DNA damage response exonuclease, partial [Anderseniella sp.]|nr:ligase-associated DNA damage response exonuclease [Anderseniella sp.]
HADHARPGNAHVLATPETLSIMQVRYGERAGGSLQAVEPGEIVTINGVDVSVAPAGHILGAAQVILDWKGYRAVVSGDYKRAGDPTCAPFEVVKCDLFITEATFGLPVFRHEDAGIEARRLVASLAATPERTHLLGTYGLGKCQRMISLIRQAGYDRPIWLNGALQGLCDYYQAQGIALGDLRPVAGEDKQTLKGELVMCPPSALADRWSRRMADPLTAFASGWMRVRGRARQRGVELPLIVSDHADWPELIQTIRDVEAGEIWVTHGREDALLHQISLMGLKGRALALVGFEDEGE